MLWGSTGLSESECRSAVLVPLPACGGPTIALGSSQAGKVQTGIWEQLTEKWLRLKQSFGCHLQRQEQMFPIKLWLLRCECLADNKQQEQPCAIRQVTRAGVDSLISNTHYTVVGLFSASSSFTQLPILWNPQELRIFETSPTLSGLAEVCMWLLQQKTGKRMFYYSVSPPVCFLMLCACILLLLNQFHVESLV